MDIDPLTTSSEGLSLEVSLETLLSDDNRWSNQQAELDKSLVEHLSDQDLDAISLSEFLVTTAQYKIQLYSSSQLFQNTSVFSLGSGLDFNVDICRLPDGTSAAVKRVKLSVPFYRKNGKTVSSLSRRVRKCLQEIRVTKHQPVEACENILTLLGASWEDVQGEFATPSLVFEYAEYGTLRQYLSNSLPSVSSHDKRRLAMQVGVAISTVHNCGICHGDIKLDNVLVVRDCNGDPVAKLSDFGSSVIRQPGDTMKPFWGTTVYNAPEVRKNNDSQSAAVIKVEMLFACDVFSFGLLLYEAFHDGLNYWTTHGNHDSDIDSAIELSKLVNCGSACPLSNAEMISCRSAIKLCLVNLPEQRAEIGPILVQLGRPLDTLSHPDKHMLGLHEETIRNMISLANPVTLITIVNGGGHFMGHRFVPRPPLAVQKIIFAAYERNAKSSSLSISGFMNLQLGICYFLGFGVDRNPDGASECLFQAAVTSYPSLRPLVSRLREFSKQTDGLKPFPPLDNEIEADDISVLLGALEQDVYTSPLYAIGQVTKHRNPRSNTITSKLHSVAYDGDTTELKHLIDAGLTDYIAEDGFTALMLACVDGSLAKVELLLANGSNLHLRDSSGYTVWHMLVMFPAEDVPAVASLFKTHSTDPGFIDTYSASPYELLEMFDQLLGTPLHWAIQTNNLTAMTALLDSGAQVDIHYHGLLSPIALAASLRLYSALALLCDRIQPNLVSTYSANPFFYLNECHPLRLVFLHGAELETSTLKTLKLLSEKWDINSVDDRRWTPLLKMCLTGFSEVDRISTLAMARLARVDVEDQLYTPLVATIIGCINNLPSNSSLPLEFLDDTNVAGMKCKTSLPPGPDALYWATVCQNTETMHTILKQDRSLADKPASPLTGEYPLHILARQSNSLRLLSAFETLINFGADPTSETETHGLTPLGTFVVEQPHDFDDSVFAYLLDISSNNKFIARISQTSSRDTSPNAWTALHLATAFAADFTGLQNYRPLKVLRHILQFQQIRSLLEIRDRMGFTPVLLAASRACYATIFTLANAGADLTVMSPQGSTCMSILLEMSRRPHMDLIKQFGRKWEDKVFREGWRHNAYKAAVYVSEKLAMTGGYTGLVLPKLHIAAYMCDVDEVHRLLGSGECDVNEVVGRNASCTARQLLEGIIHRSEQNGRPWPHAYKADADLVIEALMQAEGMHRS